MRIDARVFILRDMLTYRRPMGSAAERLFRQRYLWGLPGVTADTCGNLHVLVPRVDGTPSRVLWSSHTDTVHRESGRQRVHLSRRGRTLSLPARSGSNCLGADDTVGVWLMVDMIGALVPGHYVFHYGEERGGVGSSAVVADHPEYFAGLDAAIAFDRRGTRDVITHQSYGRCCSDPFAASLAAQLPGDYRACDTGIYTDTAEYTDLIGECTNVSVGYAGEHTAGEWIDVRHALALCDALYRFDESALVIDRHPGDPDPDDVLDFRHIDWAKWKDWREGDPAADVHADAPETWDYGMWESPDLGEDDRATLRELGWATPRRRWEFQ